MGVGKIKRDRIWGLISERRGALRFDEDGGDGDTVPS